MARSADGQRSPARLSAKKKWSSSGETEIGRGARTDKADAKFESESPHQRGIRAGARPVDVAIDPQARWRERLTASGRRRGFPLKRNGRAQARPRSGAARERIKPMQNLRARVRTRGVIALVRCRVLLPLTPKLDGAIG